jgi:hypothetical protein
MLVQLLGCLALIAGTALAEWPRFVSGAGKGSFTDSPPAHSLAYFRVDPCLRPALDSLSGALDCTWVGKPPPTAEERKSWASTRSDLVEVGKIGKLTIFDLWYQREGRFYPDFDVRSVLVKAGDDQFHEINVQVRFGSLFPASEIINLDGESILIAKSHDGGNHNRIDETLYMFRPSGTETPDFKAVGEAVAKLTPPNMSIRGWAHDYATMTDLVETYRNDLGLPPVAVQERLRISVTYRFVNGRAIVTGSKFEPYSQ